MSIKKLRLLVTMLIGLHVLQTPVQATVFNTSTTMPSVLTPTILMASGLYLGYNYLTRQNFLVSKKHEYAQAWYETIAAKYNPILKDIIFIQTPKSDFISDKLADFAKKCSWTSSYNHIYFSGEALKEINYLYKKALDGHALDEKEIGKLAGHEFTLLHEAGHIKNNDAQTLLASLFLLLGTTKIIENVQKEDITTTKDYVLSEGITLFKNSSLEYTFFAMKVPGTLTIVSTASFIAALTTILRYQETNADNFAIKNADLNALEEAIKKFESQDNDPLFDIENASLDPYIETDSIIGLFVQNFVEFFEMGIGYGKKQFYSLVKSNNVTRQIFDFVNNPIHQSPYIRAQAIKHEIAKRTGN